MDKKVIPNATPEELQLIEDAWLGMEFDESLLANPLELLYEGGDEDWIQKLVWLMTQPENIHVLCKYIFNIDIPPIQSVVLQEVWSRKFPMLVASRGFGKATTVDTPVLSEHGFVRMGDISIGDRVYSRDGKLCNVTGIFPQGKRQVYRVKLNDGRYVDCCEDHLWVVHNRWKEEVLSTKQIIEKGIKYPPKKTGGAVYKYSIPNCEPIELDKKDLPIDPYIFGCLLGDGSMTSLTPRISSDDNFIINEFIDRLDGFVLNRDKSNNNYNIVDKEKLPTEKTSVLGNKYLSKTENRLTKILKDNDWNFGCKDKYIPEIYKNSSIEDRYELVRGLLDTDGSINTSGAIEFTNVNEKLIDDTLDVLRSLGIRCQKGLDDRSGQFQTMPQGTTRERTPCFRIYINTSKPVFKLPRKLDRIKKKQTKGEKYVSIVDIERIDRYEEMQCISVDSPDSTYITKDYIVTHNTFLLSLYAMIRAFLIPGRKIVIVGAAFRQSKFLFEYMKTIWANAPVLRSLCRDGDGPKANVDRCLFNINGSVITCLPLGNGDKIRGQRANDIIADEFSSIPRDIFETVVAGFANVASSPIAKVKREARIAKAKELGLYVPENAIDNDPLEKGNQIIISGTAYYDFNHFADYWRNFKRIIESGGDDEKLREVFGGSSPGKGFDYRDYSILRIPVDILPPGFMDAGQIARARATVHSGVFQNEYGAIFSSDSTGFYKRSTIEKCVVGPDCDIMTKDGTPFFTATLKGSKSKKYVFGIDPASEVDNFSIVVLEVHPDHRRIVYAWTTNRQKHKSVMKKALTDEHDYFSYCARKVRDLMKVFPCEEIAIDSQGGGYALYESLHDKDKLKDGEQMIWEIIDDDKEKECDNYQGQHIVRMIQFANSDWMSESNQTMRKDFEDKVLLFPYFDTVTLGLSSERDEIEGREFDTLEDCVFEIEKLKDELSMIVHSQTNSGRDKFDTPEVQTGPGKKERIRKDRYSALLMANWSGRLLTAENMMPDYQGSIGGWADGTRHEDDGPDMYNGPQWWTQAMKDAPY
jgi:hypothetical protein